MPTVKTLYFKIEEAWLTQFLRDLWMEGSYARAFAVLECLEGLPAEVGHGVLRGTHQLLEGGTWEPDTWRPNFSFCAFGQYPDPANLAALAEQGAKLERDVERLQDLVIGLAKRLMREGYADGKTQQDMDWLLRTMPDEALKRNRVEERGGYSSQRTQLVFGSSEEGWATEYGFIKGIDPGDILRQLGLNVEKYVERQLELDKSPLPDPDPTLTSKNGYITPDGSYYPCEWMEHRWLAGVIEEQLHIPEVQLIKCALSQIATDWPKAYLPADDYIPTFEQVVTTVLWSQKHGVKVPEWTRPREK